MGKLFGVKESAFDEMAEKAREYRSKQQGYINKMLRDLKSRLAAGDDTPSILGNIFRQGLLSDEEVLLASYTGSMYYHSILFQPYRLLIALLQSLLASISAIRSLGSLVFWPTEAIFSRMALKLFVRCTTANHLDPTSPIGSTMSKLYILLVILNFLPCPG